MIDKQYEKRDVEPFSSYDSNRHYQGFDYLQNYKSTMKQTTKHKTIEKR